MVCRFCGGEAWQVVECRACHEWIDAGDTGLGGAAWRRGILSGINFFQGRKLGSEVLLGIAQQVVEGKVGARGSE